MEEDGEQASQPMNSMGSLNNLDELEGDYNKLVFLNPGFIN